MKKNWHIICYLIGPLLLILGIIINSSESSTLAKLKETTGKIISTEVSANVRKKTSYSPIAKYSYEVNGKKFEGNRIGLAKFMYSTKESAAEVLTPYPVGKTVPVFYLPEDPQTAYLDINEMGNGEMLIFSSIMVMIFVTPVVWFIRRQSLKR
jgi:hypothetical protein